MRTEIYKIFLGCVVGLGLDPTEKDLGRMVLMEEKKRARLTNVAKMYYEQNMGQKDIAEKIGVSRPMVSKLLQEARDLGIVTITINEMKSEKQILVEKLMEQFRLKDVILVDTEHCDGAEIEEKYAEAVSGLFDKNQSYTIGVGCGSTLGMIASGLERGADLHLSGDICPLIGGFKATYRSYHTNELVRSMSEKMGLKATYLYLPALLSSKEEKDLYTATELYQNVQEMWNRVDVALVNISGLYSAPDFATSIRFGRRLVRKKAVGRFLAHYYDINGDFIVPKEDNMVQAELLDLKSAKELVAICSEMADAKVIVGAMKTGFFSKLILTEKRAREICNQ